MLQIPPVYTISNNPLYFSSNRIPLNGDLEPTSKRYNALHGDLLTSVYPTKTKNL